MNKKMILSAYLVQRGKKAKALTRGEAALLGIPYPLQSGWPKRYGTLEIDDQLFDRLIECATASQLATEERGRRARAKFTPGAAISQHQEFVERSPALLGVVSGFVLRKARRYRLRTQALRKKISLGQSKTTA